MFATRIWQPVAQSVGRRLLHGMLTLRRDVMLAVESVNSNTWSGSLNAGRGLYHDPTNLKADGCHEGRVAGVTIHANKFGRETLYTGGLENPKICQWKLNDKVPFMVNFKTFTKRNCFFYLPFRKNKGLQFEKQIQLAMAIRILRTPAIRERGCLSPPPLLTLNSR